MKLGPTTTVFAAALAAALAAGCHTNDAARAQTRDAYGNYQSTARYNAMERAEFDAAMDAGLRDFDERLHSMELEANALGPDALEEYHDHLDDLMQKRRSFDGELARSRAMLEDEWRKHREDVAEKYVDLREDLDDVYDEVVEEA
jgi:hypothetical protein